IEIACGRKRIPHAGGRDRPARHRVSGEDQHALDRAFDLRRLREDEIRAYTAAVRRSGEREGGETEKRRAQHHSSGLRPPLVAVVAVAGVCVLTGSDDQIVEDEAARRSAGLRETIYGQLDLATALMPAAHDDEIDAGEPREIRRFRSSEQ